MAAQPKIVRYGLIGMGWWAREVHLRNLASVSQAEVVALASRSEDNLRAAQALCSPPPKVFTDYRELLDRWYVDAVVVCTPHHEHTRIVLDALAAGKHVFCEKPLATTLEECDAIAAAAKKANRIVQVGFELRYAPLCQKVKEVAASGDLGPLASVWCHVFRGPYRPQGWRALEEAGGVLLDVGIHYLDLCTYFTGGEPKHVAVASRSHLVPTVPDTTWTTIEYDNGVTANLGLVLLTERGPQIQFGVLGLEGRLHADFDARRIEVYRSDSAEVQVYCLDPWGGPEVYGFSGAREIHEAFIDCILVGRQPLADVQVGRQSLALALAVKESARTRQLTEVGG